MYLSCKLLFKYEKKDRDGVRKQFMENKVIICARIGFDMTIKNNHIRFIIHTCTPDNLKSYYQESGLVGCDQNRIYCRFYHQVKSRSN
uniref:Helicase C-terminal domain-containing protein n=1 Tax=Rhabditophanes sp. KR3021 TaxID=114890 RepID=A0AC35UGG2_9BILA